MIGDCVFMRFGEVLRFLREEKDWTQKELGQKINVSDRVIGYWESNDRFPKDESIINMIADLFNVSTDYLLGRTGDRNFGNSNEGWPDDVKIMLRDAAKLTNEQKEIIKRLISEFINEKK